MCVRAYEWRNAAHILCSVCQDGTAFQSCVKKKWIHNIETFLIFFSTLFPRPPLLQKLCCGWPSGPLGRHATCVLGRLPLLPVSQPQGATCSRRVFCAWACCEVGSRVGVRSRSVQVGNLSSSQPPPPSWARPHCPSVWAFVWRAIVRGQGPATVVSGAFSVQTKVVVVGVNSPRSQTDCLTSWLAGWLTDCKLCAR